MKIQFNVNIDSILAFAEVLSDGEVKNEIKGTHGDDCIIIDVLVSREDRDLIEQLEDLSESDE